MACSVALDFTGIDDGVRDGSLPGDAQHDGAAADSDAALSNDALGGPDGTGDAIVDGGSDVGDALVESACPGAGPTGVVIGSFCIDSTEVTVDQYTQFLAAKAGETTGQPSTCTWNGSLVPGGWPQTPGNVPVVNVNWCMAYTYCDWAGKRLCGDPGGGPADPNGWGDPAKSQWFKACSRNNDGLHVYPYGNTYAPKTCNGQDYDAGKVLPSVASCEGAYPGLFDMSGNVFEWEDSCLPPAPDASDQTGDSDFCHTRGGAFGENSNILRCDEGVMFTRGSAADSLGIRCCSK